MSSPKKKRKQARKYKKKRKALILSTLHMNENEYDEALRTGNMLCKWCDLVQQRPATPITKKEAEELMVAGLTIFSVFGSISHNPMEALLYIISGSLKELSKQQRKGEHVTPKQTPPDQFIPTEKQ
jgi:hypothetical protein